MEVWNELYWIIVLTRLYRPCVLLRGNASLGPVYRDWALMSIPSSAMKSVTQCASPIVANKNSEYEALLTLKIAALIRETVPPPWCVSEMAVSQLRPLLGKGS